MKKLLLALVAVFGAMSAHAVDYYLIGGFNSWSLAQASCKFTEGSNGEYTLDLNVPLTSGFKINDGTWSNGNANFGGSDKLTVGQTYNLVASGTSGNIEFSNSNLTLYNAHLVFNPTAKTLVVTGEEQQAKTIYGIHGDIFGKSDWSTINMTEQNGKFVLENQMVVSGHFGIKAMNSLTEAQTDWISADGSADVVVGQTMKCKSEGTNFAIGGGTYTFTFDPSAMTLVVTGNQTGETPGTDYSTWWVNIIGPFNDWADNGVHPENGISTTANLGIGTGGFKVKVYDTADHYYISETGSIPVNTWVQLVEDTSDGPAIQIEGAAIGSVYTVQFNCTNNQVYVTPTGSSSEGGIPANVYVIGDISGNVWTPANGVPMTNEGNGVFSVKNLNIVYGSDGATSGYFALTTVQSSDWNVVNANRFGPAVKDTEATVGVNKVDGTGDVSWSIAPGVYDMTFDYNAKTLNITLVGSTTDPTPEGPVTASTIYLVGAGDGLSWDLPGKAIEGNNNVFTFTIDNLSKFKLSVKNATEWDGDNGYNSGAYSTGNARFSASSVYPSGQTLPLMAWGEDQMLPYEATYTITVDFNTMTMKAVAASAGSTEAPAVYIRGEMNNWLDDGLVDLWKLNYNSSSDEYTFNCSGRTQLPANTGFKFADGSWGNINYGYGPVSLESNGKTIVDLVFGTMENISLSEDFTGSITLKINTDGSATAVFTSNTSGVDSLVSEEGETVYYNLQGQKVANPERGIFVKVTAGKAEKVVL